LKQEQKLKMPLLLKSRKRWELILKFYMYEILDELAGSGTQDPDDKGDQPSIGLDVHNFCRPRTGTDVSLLGNHALFVSSKVEIHNYSFIFASTATYRGAFGVPIITSAPQYESASSRRAFGIVVRFTVGRCSIY
jgi:hypothetical protein